MLTRPMSKTSNKPTKKIALTSVLRDPEDEEERTLTTMNSAVANVFAAIAHAETTNPDDAKSPFAGFHVAVVDPAEITAELIRSALSEVGFSVHVFNAPTVVHKVLEERRVHALVLVVEDDPSWVTMLLKMVVPGHLQTRHIVWIPHRDPALEVSLREAGAHDVVWSGISLPWGLAFPVLAADPEAVPTQVTDPAGLLKAAVDMQVRLTVPRGDGGSSKLKVAEAETAGLKDEARAAAAKHLEEVNRLKADVEKFKEGAKRTHVELADAQARLKKAAQVLGDKDAEIARVTKELAAAREDVTMAQGAVQKELAAVKEELASASAQFHTADEMLEITRSDRDEKAAALRKAEVLVAASAGRMQELQNRIISMGGESGILNARVAELESRLAGQLQANDQLDKASAAASFLRKFEPAVREVLDFAEGVLGSGVKVPALASAVDDLKRLLALLKTLE